jgi:diguanylate cyclase (GGDEF)-like protein/PAS domain S-box-containing protein
MTANGKGDNLEQTVIKALFNNAALLLVLSVIYEVSYFVTPRFRRVRPVVNGILIALICAAIMGMPFTLEPGVVFDTRSILISVVALIFGLIPTLITVVVAAIIRLLMGGAGTVPGIAVILTSALIGLAWRRWIFPKSTKWRWLSVYAMSLCVHVTMLACMLLLPSPDNLIVIRAISWPVMVIYPIASVLLGLLLIRQQEYRSAQIQLMHSEQLYRRIAENISDVVWTTDLNLKTTYISPSVERLLGEDLQTHLKRTMEEKFPPDSMRRIKDLLSEELKREEDPGCSKDRSRVIEVEHYRADGTSIWLAMNISMLRDDQGRPIGLQGVSRDITERKHSEEQQKQNLKDLLESQRIAQIGTWRLDLTTNQVVWSEELYKMYGFDPTLPPPPYTEHMKLFTPESWQKLSTSLEMTRTSGIPYELELETVTLDGSNGWMWVRGEAETDEKGSILSLWGAAQDITKHKKAETAIRQSEEKFQLLFNKAPLGYQSLDFEGNFIDVNQQWLDTMGYSKEDVIGKWFGDFICPEYVEAFRQRFPIFKAQGYIHSEFEMLSKSGLRLTIAFEGRVGYGVDGEFRQTHCILQDITNQRKAERALIESEERYRCLFEYSGVGIGYYTTDGILVSFNKKALENMGGKLEDYIGKSFSAFFPEEEADQYLLRFKKAISSDQPQEYEDHLVLGTGPKWFSSTFTRVMNITGEVIGIQISSLDITERKLAEEALSESQAILKAAFENSQAGIAIADAPDGKLRYVNKAGLLIRDQSEELLVKDIDFHNYVKSWNILHFDGTPFADEEVPLARAVLFGEACSDEFIIRRDNFEDRYVLANAVPIKDSNNTVKAGMVVFLDVTEKRLAEESVRKQNDLFASLLKLLPVGVFMVDAEKGRPLVVNEMGKELLGSGILPDANEHNLAEVYKAYKGDTQNHYPMAEMPIALGMKGISAHVEDMVVERPDGTRILLEVFGTPVKDTNGRPWASLVTFQDITARKKAEDELIFLAYHDQLTGLYNRRFFEETLKTIDKKENLPLSIIMCDVNGLKLVNDSFGHDVGDELLIRTAATIKNACRPEDILSRTGGDEFTILLPKTTADEAMDIVAKIEKLASVEQVANIELSIASGYETKTTESQSFVEIIANAENHMYRHKLYARSSIKGKTIDLILKTLFEKSSREAEHSIRVSEICHAIASAMSLDREAISRIKTAGLIHDIGKIGINESILNKPAKLNDYEWAEMKKHPEIGWRILSASNEFFDLAYFVLNHHERWDGHGYPNGVDQENIPLEARIIALADAFDAMTSIRSYRSGMSEEQALKEIKRCSGTQFDPKIVDAFLGIFGQSVVLM